MDLLGLDSLPIDIYFRSKYHTYWKKNRRFLSTQQKVREARNHAIREAWFELWNIFVNTIAKKTGRLRKSIFEMFMSQLRKLALNRLTIEFHHLSGPTWAVYHIFGPDGKAKSDIPYIDPTTKGTRPLNEFIFMDMFLALIIKHMEIEFTALGLKWRQFVKVL